MLGPWHGAVSMPPSRSSSAGPSARARSARCSRGRAWRARPPIPSTCRRSARRWRSGRRSPGWPGRGPDRPRVPRQGSRRRRPRPRAQGDPDDAREAASLPDGEARRDPLDPGPRRGRQVGRGRLPGRRGAQGAGRRRARARPGARPGRVVPGRPDGLGHDREAMPVPTGGSWPPAPSCTC